ncbi:MAG: FtsK/SpoIIIE family protein, partial [Acidobacteria bacterium]|nr:FtsK/SpoIIIE family protein [Acidobacteriota bacterium]
MPGEDNSKKHEFIGVFLLIVAILLLLCLVSYNPRDSSFNALSLKLTVDNMIGKLGAHVSDFLFQVFGYAAFILPLPLLILSWKLIFGRPVHTPYLRAFGLFLLLTSSSAALQLAAIKGPDVNFMPGGVTGVLMIDMLLPNLNTIGTGIVVAGAFLLGILASTTLSLGGAFSRFTWKITVPRLRFWDRIREWRRNRKPVRAVVNIKPAAP